MYHGDSEDEGHYWGKGEYANMPQEKAARMRRSLVGFPTIQETFSLFWSRFLSREFI